MNAIAAVPPKILHGAKFSNTSPERPRSGSRPRQRKRLTFPISHYFGKPVYTYSLKQGIQDGFLAPYKVVKVHIDVDVEGYRPEKGETDRYGNEIEDRIYSAKDFDRTLVIDDRTKLVAHKVSEFLKEVEIASRKPSILRVCERKVYTKGFTFPQARSCLQFRGKTIKQVRLGPSELDPPTSEFTFASH